MYKVVARVQSFDFVSLLTCSGQYPSSNATTSTLQSVEDKWNYVAFKYPSAQYPSSNATTSTLQSVEDKWNYVGFKHPSAQRKKTMRTLHLCWLSNFKLAQRSTIHKVKNEWTSVVCDISINERINWHGTTD
jgi:hypothetical protein